MSKIKSYREFLAESDASPLDVKTHSVEEIAKKHKVPVQSILDQIEMGSKVEKEHTTDPNAAEEIARDHLWELPDYYTKLKKVEG